MNLHSHARLWADREARSVSLLQNGHVELVWDRVVFVLRHAEFIVLHTTLRKWLIEERPDQSVTYLLSLNECRLFIQGEDLLRFCALVDETATQLPRQFVHWIDLRVHIVPLPTDTGRNLDFHDN